MRGTPSGAGFESISRWLAAALVALVAAGCHEEPTIVIRFEPQDLALPRVAATATVGAGSAMVEGGAAVAKPAIRDGGAAAVAGAAGSGKAGVEKPKGEGASAQTATGTTGGGGAVDPAASSDGGSCTSDGDCLKVKGDCCGCAQGGTARAVSKAKRTAVERALTRRCGTTTMCVEMLSNDPSCTRQAACRGGHCVLIEAGR